MISLQLLGRADIPLLHEPSDGWHRGPAVPVIGSLVSAQMQPVIREQLAEFRDQLAQEVVILVPRRIHQVCRSTQGFAVGQQAGPTVPRAHVAGRVQLGQHTNTAQPGMPDNLLKNAP